MFGKSVASRRKALVPALAATLAIGLPTAASAAPILVQSFENSIAPASIAYGPAQSAAGFGIPAFSGPATAVGVTFSGFSGIIANSPTSSALSGLPSTPFGAQSGFLQGYQGAGSAIDWAVSGLTAGRTYALSFASAGSSLVGAETFSVSAFGNSLGTFTPGSSFATTTLRFVAGPTGSGSIVFTGNAVGGNNASSLDNLSISSVPETGTWAMMILGLGCVGFALRRKRSVAAFA